MTRIRYTCTVACGMCAAPLSTASQARRMTRLNATLSTVAYVRSKSRLRLIMDPHERTSVMAVTVSCVRDDRCDDSEYGKTRSCRYAAGLTRTVPRTGGEVDAVHISHAVLHRINLRSVPQVTGSSSYSYSIVYRTPDERPATGDGRPNDGNDGPEEPRGRARMATVC